MIWLYARHDPKLKAAVAFYGILGGKASPSTPIKPQNPLDFGHDVTVPVLGLYGGHDDNIPPDLITQMQGELQGHKEPDRRLSRRAARLLRRLPPELPPRGGA